MCTVLLTKAISENLHFFLMTGVQVCPSGQALLYFFNNRVLQAPASGSGTSIRPEYW